jgi:hypothetical protein
MSESTVRMCLACSWNKSSTRTCSCSLLELTFCSGRSDTRNHSNTSFNAGKHIFIKSIRENNFKIQPLLNKIKCPNSWRSRSLSSAVIAATLQIGGESPSISRTLVFLWFLRHLFHGGLPIGISLVALISLEKSHITFAREVGYLCR